MEHRVAKTAVVRDHAELGDTALFVAIPVAALALLIWWRAREQSMTETNMAGAELPSAGLPAGSTLTKPVRRTFLAPANQVVSIVLLVLSVLAAGAAIYDTYLIGDSGAKATWEGGFTTEQGTKG